MQYDREITNAGVVRDVDAKVRKYGLTSKRIGNGIHLSQFTEGRNGLVVPQSEGPAKELGKLVHQLYESAEKFFQDIGEDPRYFLPRVTSYSAYGLVFGDIGSQYMVSWAGARGLGRLVAILDLYITELAEWEGDVQRNVSSLLTAMPPGARGVRQTIDFNAHTDWMGTHAYNVWMSANKGPDDPDWNGFKPFFIGVDDLPEYYTPEFLADQRQAINDEELFRLDYPRTPEDLYIQKGRHPYRWKFIQECREPEYAGDSCSRYVHGVDTSDGEWDSDFQAMVTRGWKDGQWIEACPPIHERIPEPTEFAMQIHNRANHYGGVVVVEKNVGAAVIKALRDLSTNANYVLYTHKHKDEHGKQKRRLGFVTTGASKRIMIADYQKALREGTLGIVTEELAQEAREFEYKDDSRIAAAPDRAGAADDLIMADMVGMQGTTYNDIGSMVMGR